MLTQSAAASFSLTATIFVCWASIVYAAACTVTTGSLVTVWNCLPYSVSIALTESSQMRVAEILGWAALRAGALASRIVAATAATSTAMSSVRIGTRWNGRPLNQVSTEELLGRMCGSAVAAVRVSPVRSGPSAEGLG
ncbi:hypothetical protein [Streptomyces canus]|uniref:hypothetical protein n=1 Tax=Streptomyces canus TaxID=58343 RepID=UPI0030E4F4BC